MKGSRAGHICLCCIFVFVLAVGMAFPSVASDTGFDIKAGEVVFLLDTSESMNKQDKERLGMDAIRQAVYSLPSDYSVGLVAYGTDIQAVIPFGEAMEQWESQLEQISYSGYTNAGEGLNRAVQLFSDQENVNRYIVMLTDGEIDMPDSQGREDSRKLYEDASRIAKEKGIKIYIAAIGNDFSNAGMHIFDSAEMTDGAIYWVGQSGTLSDIMMRILCERMNFSRSTLGVTDGKGGSVYAELPSAGAEHVKVIILSSQGMENVTADYTAKSGRIIKGQNFAVVDIVRPAGEAVEIRFETPDIASVEAYMIAEYTAELEVKVDYRSEADESGSVQQDGGRKGNGYKHFADLSVSLADAGGKNDSIWSSPWFEGAEVFLEINGNPVSGNIHNGEIRYSLQIDGITEAVIEVDTGSFAEKFAIKQPVTVAFSPPMDPEAPPDYRPLWIVLVILVLAMLVILLAWLKKSRATVIYMEQPASGKEPARKMETKMHSYTGKLNLYVVQTKNGEDIAPQVYRLFGKQSAKITLSQILSFCGIRLGKIGAEDIGFYPGYDKSLIVMDQSEHCTVMRGTEILKKGMGYPVYYNEKITIIFEDGITEMELYYKNLKPSEQEGVYTNVRGRN